MTLSVPADGALHHAPVARKSFHGINGHDIGDRRVCSKDVHDFGEHVNLGGFGCLVPSGK